MIAADVEGIPTDVIEVGVLRALQAPTDRWRPAPGGVSIGHYRITAGTLGVVVRERTTGDRLILSNNHVLANSNDALPGDAILQPGPADGGQLDTDLIARLERFVPIQFNSSPGSCSVAKSVARAANALAELIGSQHRLTTFQQDPGAANLVDQGNQDTMQKVQPRYEDPFPLSEKYFLASRQMTPQPGQPGQVKNRAMGIYLLDVFGNEILVHFEEPGCFDPMPVKFRPRPPSMSQRTDLSNDHGFFYVEDVYRGTHMQNVERGTLKYLRVIQSPEKRHWTPHGWWTVAAPAVNWHDFNHKAILGTVPIREDGSAYFAVPANKFLYFQVLDENRMMIHSMRSGTFVQPGETVGCVGCHEHRRTAPAIVGNEPPLAMHDEPSELKGWFGPPRYYNYMTELQPVLDRHCVSCHDYGNAKAADLILAADRTITFNTSYEELWGKHWKNGFLGVHGAGPPPIQQAYSWGSHTSGLIRMLRKGHYDIKLDRESWERLVTWIDLNGPYYPGHASAYPDNWTGRSPLTEAQLKRLGELAPLTLRDTWRSPYLGPQLSFDRPEKSRVLSGLAPESPEHSEALATIRAGKQMLAKKPRLDMPGFRPCESHENRDRRRARLQAIEAHIREAVHTRAKVYDPGVR